MEQKARAAWQHSLDLDPRQPAVRAKLAGVAAKGAGAG
jgi:hypothetical protein